VYFHSFITKYTLNLCCLLIFNHLSKIQELFRVPKVIIPWS